MEFLLSFVDLVLHLDKHLPLLIQQYGTWIYLALFLVIFCETGLVVTPFLPGDSLLFIAGAIAATGAMAPDVLVVLLVSASFLGDNTNYWVGRLAGPKIFKSNTSRLLNRDYLDKTRQFYQKHGGKAIILARFFPIIRTFAPFVAGMGRMDYRRFIAFSFSGSIAWVGSFVLGGYFFGNIPFIKQNLTLVMLAIIFVSILPGIIGYLRHRFQ
ncbi:MAG: DedA family protein [Sulfurimicrobium sp.]|nr:DedA family protein [Sulfurimicrobium sp.]MDP2961949.1 DedA family protein [Sulfurimicrobium sp.]